MGICLRRREFIAGLGSAAMAEPLTATAQQGARVRRIGVLLDFAAPTKVHPRVAAGYDAPESATFPRSNVGALALRLFDVARLHKGFCHLTAHEVGRECWQSVKLAIGTCR